MVDNALYGYLKIGQRSTSDGHIDVFDPTRLVDGVEPSDDAILPARSKSYSVSAYRRWDGNPEA